MTEHQHPQPVPTAVTAPPPDLPAPTAATPARAGTSPGDGRARRWLAGAVLVTVGLVAGGGATYAFTSAPAATVTGSGQDSELGDGTFPGTRPVGPPPGTGSAGGAGGTPEDQPA